MAHGHNVCALRKFYWHTATLFDPVYGWVGTAPAELHNRSTAQSPAKPKALIFQAPLQE